MPAVHPTPATASPRPANRSARTLAARAISTATSGVTALSTRSPRYSSRADAEYGICASRILLDAPATPTSHETALAPPPVTHSARRAPLPWIASTWARTKPSIHGLPMRGNLPVSKSNKL